MPDIKTLALRKAAVETLADEFDAAMRPYTSAASVINFVRDRCPPLTPGTGWSVDRLALRVADEVHKRRTGVRADWTAIEQRVLAWEGRPIHPDFYRKD